MVWDSKESWMELCELAAKEQDPQKLLKLMLEINRLLEAKEQRVGIAPSSVSSSVSENPTKKASQT
jgi:hypothetical protein